MILDSAGHLLVVDSGNGVLIIVLAGGDCDSVISTKKLIADTTLNHGLALSDDGKKLYASNSDVVYSWDYDAASQTVSNIAKIVTGMLTDDHTTRTLLLSKSLPGKLIVSRGSTSNIDVESAQLSSGHAQIRYFDASGTGQDWMSGQLIGWGLRNSVGIAEHPVDGGLFSVENSADEIRRNGVDIHQDNPAEELNYHGSLKNPSLNGGKQGDTANFGYPSCFAAWQASSIHSGSFQTGDQFSIDGTVAGYGSAQDDQCKSSHIAPRLVFHPHMAPLDIKFTPEGSTAYVSLHGSWDSAAPVGYKLGAVAFGANGMPLEMATSMTAVKDVMTNPDISKCPGACFRPAGLLIGAAGQVYMTSDATGEIWVVRQGGGRNGTVGAATGTAGSATGTAISKS